jgi:predicted metal-dependent peptidase
MTINIRKLTPEEEDEQRQKMSDKAAEGKLRGNMPGWLADKLGKMLEGKIDWRTELLEEMIPLIKSLPTFRKPRRRNPNPEIFLPGNIREGIKLSVGIDTSGSIGDRERAYFLGEIASIYEQFPVGSVEMTVYFHHTEMYHKIEMSDMEELKGYQFQSGGTDHHDIMEKMVEDGTNYAVFLTDGYSDFPETKQIPNILWIVTEEQGMEHIPEGFGKKINVKISELKEVN